VAGDVLVATATDDGNDPCLPVADSTPQPTGNPTRIGAEVTPPQTLQVEASSIYGFASICSACRDLDYT